MPRAPRAPGHAPPRIPWASSTRRARLPKNWPALRQATLERYPTCTCTGCRHHDSPCTHASTDADHTTPGDDHTQLAGLCHNCHATKSSAEGNAALARARASARRTPPPHPGLT